MCHSNIPNPRPKALNPDPNPKLGGGTDITLIIVSLLILLTLHLLVRRSWKERNTF